MVTVVVVVHRDLKAREPAFDSKFVIKVCWSSKHPAAQTNSALWAEGLLGPSLSD